MLSWSFPCSWEPFYWILFLCLASHVLMKALVHQEFTLINSFTWLSRAGVVSHPQFRTRFSFLTEFQFKFCTRLSPRKSSPQAWFYRISLPTEFHIFCFSFRVIVSLTEWIHFIFSGGTPGINFRCYCTPLFWVHIILGGRWNSLFTVSGCQWLGNLVFGFLS